jgi:signal transduction histidine kinase
LDETEEEELYYIITEALNNALKHAEATRIELTFAIKHDELEVIIQDNGQGFDPQRQPRGQGLANIYNRAGNIGRKVFLESSVGEGTTIRVNKEVGAKAHQEYEGGFQSSNR